MWSLNLKLTRIFSCESVSVSQIFGQKRQKTNNKDNKNKGQWLNVKNDWTPSSSHLYQRICFSVKSEENLVKY